MKARTCQAGRVDFWKILVGDVGNTTEKIVWGSTDQYLS